MNWYFKVLGNYAVFSGRACRKEYWYFILFNFIFTVLLSFIDIAIHPERLTHPAIADQVFFSLSSIYQLAMLLPSWAVFVRRLHDTGHTGWWALAPIAVIPFIAVIVLLFMVSSTLALIVGFLGALGYISTAIYLFVLTLRDSDPGPNKYGPNPK